MKSLLKSNSSLFRVGAAAKDDAVPRADEVGGGGRNEDEAASESDEVSVISIGWMVLAEPTGERTRCSV